MRLVFGLIAICLAANASAQMTGFVNNRFMERADQSCFEKQRAQRPMTVPDDDIKIFCQCNSGYLSERLTNNDAMAIHDGSKKIDPAMIVSANKSCESKIPAR